MNLNYKVQTYRNDKLSCIYINSPFLKPKPFLSNISSLPICCGGGGGFLRVWMKEKSPLVETFEIFLLITF